MFWLTNVRHQYLLIEKVSILNLQKGKLPMAVETNGTRSHNYEAVLTSDARNVSMAKITMVTIIYKMYVYKSYLE